MNFKTFNLNLNPNNWIGSNAPFTYTIIVEDILDDDEPKCDYIPSSIFSIVQDEELSYSYIYDLITTNNNVTFYASKKPFVPLDIRLKVARN